MTPTGRTDTGPTWGDVLFCLTAIGLLASVWRFMSSDRGRDWTLRHWPPRSTT